MLSVEKYFKTALCVAILSPHNSKALRRGVCCRTRKIMIGWEWRYVFSGMEPKFGKTNVCLKHWSAVFRAEVWKMQGCWLVKTPILEYRAWPIAIAPSTWLCSISFLIFTSIPE